MATPTIAKLKADNPNLEISILGLGKTEEKDFNTRQFFENNPNVHKYYDSQLAYHPTYWDHTAFNQKDLLLIQKDFQDLREQESTSFDSIVVVTLQSDYDKHRIDRFAWACQTSLDYNEKEMRIYPTDDEVLQATRVFENTKYEISQSHNQRRTGTDNFCA